MSTIDTVQPAALDTSKASGDLYAALAKAQADVESVGKDGTNTQRGYRYATTEAMIRGSRQHLAGHGLAFFSTWSQDAPDVAPGDIGKQHVAARVTIHWTLGHATGGQISGRAHMDAIGSPARPPDKAVAAAVTYGLGFLLRGLLLLDRADEDEHSPDKRHEPEPNPALDRLVAMTERLAGSQGLTPSEASTKVKQEADVWPKGEPTQDEIASLTMACQRLLAPPPEPAPTAEPEPTAKTRGKGKASEPAESREVQAARKAADNARAAYKDVCEAEGVPERPWLDIGYAALGKPWDIAKGSHGAEDYEKLAAQYEAEIDRVRQSAAGGGA
jgi:hypothetical protein